MQIHILIIVCLMFTSCILKDESPLESYGNDVNLIQSGDIIITNSGNDTIIHLDSDGNYKGVLVDSQTDSTLIFNGLAYDSINDAILYTHDSTTGSQDAVKSISLFDGEVSTVITNSNLNGVLPAVARLTGGELLIVEGTTAAEKFLANGTRSGAPFISGLTASVVDLTRLSDGGFITCSSGTANTVRAYDATGTEVAMVTSQLPLPTLGALAATSCSEDPSGRIVVAYSGGTDAVRVYDSTMTNVEWTFTDTNVLTTPGKLAIRPNGNILVLDTAFNHIVEINPDGGLVRVIGGAVLATPNNIVVVP